MPADRRFSLIEEQAAAWLVERDRGFAPGRDHEFARWLAEDDRHAAAFEAFAQTWELMGETRPANASASSPTVFAGQRTRRWLPLTLAAAAALAVAAIGGWRRAPIDGKGEKAVALTMSTDVGVVRQFDLPDGTVIQLNTDSAVDVRFEAAVRRVRLVRGEAHFAVAKQVQRPFIVSAGGVDVRVVGTVFNVRLRAESVDVLVTEGKVRVGAPLAGPAAAEAAAGDGDGVVSELTAGQKVSVTRGGPVAAAMPVPLEVSSTEVRQALAWQSRRLDFDATPLSAIVAEFNRYNRHQLVVADPQLETQRFGGSFPAGDYLTFVRMLEVDFDVVAETKVGETVLRRRERP